ncbi:unnamed protein product [Vitrella brassicaformis CCMP3155]|uniref:Uncharacterized protein n=2 Tax=Vitrella brassicaformis TaxID=1169539 RepID=A0A0G4ENB0_VITBC|nr:unnamed protein product [Vitrella brassicaformis CCMP3155]|eukprot:CEL98482.1 unnamed protein product [Vitrella brassicaformis CCMP3155]
MDGLMDSGPPGLSGGNFFLENMALTGFTADEGVLMTAKELVDNALDAVKRLQPHARQFECQHKQQVEVLLEDHGLNDEDLLHPTDGQRFVEVVVRDSGIGLQHNNVDLLGTIFGSSSSAQNAANDALSVAGKFGVGLKMVLLNSHIHADGTVRIKSRLSSREFFHFSLSYSGDDGEVTAQPAEDAIATNFPFMTEFRVCIAYPSETLLPSIQRLCNYLLLAKVWHPELELRLCVECQHVDMHPFTLDTTHQHPQEVISSLIGVDGAGSSGSSSVVVHHTHFGATFKCEMVAVLDKKAPQAGHHGQQTAEQGEGDEADDDATQHEEADGPPEGDELRRASDDQTYNGTIQLYRSVNGMPLLSSEALSCGLTSLMGGFLRREGEQYGITLNNTHNNTTIAQANQDDSQGGMLGGVECVTFTIAKKTDDWTRLRVFVNVSGASMEFGSFQKSFVKASHHLETAVLQCTRAIFKALRHKCPDAFQCDEERRYEAARTIFLPVMSSNLCDIVFRSQNGAFRDEVLSLLSLAMQRMEASAQLADAPDAAAGAAGDGGPPDSQATIRVDSQQHQEHEAPPPPPPPLSRPQAESILTALLQKRLDRLSGGPNGAKAKSKKKKRRRAAGAGVAGGGVRAKAKAKRAPAPRAARDMDDTLREEDGGPEEGEGEGGEGEGEDEQQDDDANMQDTYDEEMGGGGSPYEDLIEGW